MQKVSAAQPFWLPLQLPKQWILEKSRFVWAFFSLLFCFRKGSWSHLRVSKKIGLELSGSRAPALQLLTYLLVLPPGGAPSWV